MARLKFLGAAGTVTGSKHLLEVLGQRVLVDCGLFQGLKQLRLKNWQPLPVDPRSIDVVVLTHAHLDHTGFLPRLVKDGFRGRIVATRASVELTSIILRDSGKLQEEDAEYNNRRGTSRHRPALPLYTIEDAERAAERVEGFDFFQRIPLLPGIDIEYKPAGHILGSATVTLDAEDEGERRRMVFSGDIGVYDSPFLLPPVPAGPCDYLMMESTYGNRLHSNESIEDQLTTVINDAVRKGGAIIVPAFAIARSQILLYYIGRLQEAGRIPRIPIVLDSPMAIDATEVHLKHGDDLQPAIRNNVHAMLHLENLRITRSREDSRAVNDMRGPLIIVSASGMATGGRVVHHLRHRLNRPETTVLLAGFQSEGTRGWRLQQGEKLIRIFAEDVQVRAHIETIHGLSAHGDQADLIRWLRTAERAPKKVFLVHGEPAAASALRAKIEQELGWPVAIPVENQEFDIDLDRR